MSDIKVKYWICLLSLWMNEALALYYVQDNNENTQHCNLATPNISHSSTEEYVVQLPAYLRVAENETVRVGYIKTSYIFLYRGCVLYNHVAPPNTTMVKKDLAQCYRICRSTYIGVSDTACFCLNTALNQNKKCQFCTIPCEYPKGALCGGGTHSYKTYISLYEKVDAAHGGSDGRGSCLAISPRRLAWLDCNERLLGLCKPVFIHQPELVRYSWSGYIEFCLKAGGLPINPYTYQGKNDSAEYLWSGVVRQLYVVENKNPRFSSANSIYGYIVKSGTKYILQFKNLNGSTKLLCSGDDARTSISQTNTVPTSTLIKTSTGQTDSLIHTKAKKETTTEMQVSQSENTKGVYLSTSVLSARVSNGDKDEETGTNATMLYVTVPVAVIALVVGIICIIRIVRIRRKSGTNSRPEMNHDDIKVSEAAINATYDAKSVQIGPMEAQEHNYWVLEKTDVLDKTTAVTTSFDNGCSEGMDYNLPDDLTDDVYDHTGGNKEQRQPDNDTYNHVGQDAAVDVEDMYNATERWGHKKDKNNLTENVYDRTRVDDTYNTAQRWGNMKDNDNLTENVYDRTRIDDTYNTIQNYRNVNDNGNVNDTTYDRAGDENDDNEYSTAGVVGTGRGPDDAYSHTVRQ